MNMSDLLNQRHSCRAFLDKPVPTETLEQIFELAQRAPQTATYSLGKRSLYQASKKTL